MLQEWQAASRAVQGQGGWSQAQRADRERAKEAFHDVRDFWQRLDAESRHQLLRVPVQGLLTRMPPV